jgi:two-component system, cell cycle sensor histidine kinase and response regulator CckA
MPYTTKDEDMQRMNAELQEMVAKRTMELVDANRSLSEEIAERKKTEAALRENEKKFRDLIALLPLTIYECDREGRITFTNDIGLQLFGYTREDFNRGINILDLIPPGEAAISLAHIDKMHNGELSGARDYNFRRKDGSTFPAMTFSSPIIRGDKSIGLRGVIMDITERKWSERIVTSQRDLGLALAETTSLDEALKLCLECAMEAGDLDAGAIYMIDPNSGDLDMACMRGISEGFAERTGHIPVGEEIVPFVMKGVPRYLDTSDSTIYLKDIMHEEGFRAKAMIPIHSRGKVIGAFALASRNADSIPARSRHALEAVAAQIGTSIMRAKAEEALRISEKRFRDLANLLPQPIFEFDLNGDAVFLNLMSLEVFGYGTQDLKRGIRNIRTVIPPGEMDKFASDLSKLTRGEMVRAAEYTLARKDGTTFPAIAFVSPVVRDGVMTGFRGTVIDIAERKKTETVLLESEGKFRNLAEKSVAGVYLVQDGTFQYVNAKFADILGYTVEDMAGKMRVEEVIHPDDQSLVLENLRKRISGDVVSLQYEFRIRTGAGKTRHVEVYSSLTVYQGKPAVIGTLLDITDRRRAEEALRASEAWLRQVIDLVPHFIFAKDREGRFILANKAVAEAFGTTVRDLTGKTDADVNPNRSEVDHFLKDDLFIMESGRAKEIPEETITDAAGRTRILQTTKIPVAVAPTGGKAVLGVSTDITAYKNALKALQKSEEKYRHIFENATEGIFQTTPKGRLLSVNPSLARMFGYASPEDLMTHIGNLDERVYADPEDRRRILNLLETHGHIEGVETQITRQDGKRLWISINCHAVRLPGGEVAYLEGTVDDITQRKQMEAHLLQVQKMEAIGTLAGGIAHDFNNILGAVMGYTGLAKFKTGDEKIHPYLEHVLTACERARDLVNQILTFSRRKDHEKNPILVTPLISETVNLIKSSLPAGIDVRLNLSPGPDTVLADATQIHQVLLNLCTNAAHAMRQTGGVLTISLDREEMAAGRRESIPDLKEGPYLKITVGDTGHGIHPSIMDKIFDPFFTTKELGEGTGLGLSVVYGIVRNHGGAVRVSSEPGKGSVFDIYLPLTDAGGGEAKGDAESIPCGSGHILIVDDEESPAAVIRDMLASLGYDVTTRFRSLDALEALRANPDRFDLVLADADMPNISGINLAMQMLRIRPRLPIIITAGPHETLTESEARQIGIRAFIMKPVSLRDLAQTVGRALGKTGNG